MPAIVAEIDPRGIDLPGFLRSPDNPTPAVIPVKAGNTIAKTIKNSFIFLNESEKALTFSVL